MKASKTCRSVFASLTTGVGLTFSKNIFYSCGKKSCAHFFCEKVLLCSDSIVTVGNNCFGLMNCKNEKKFWDPFVMQEARILSLTPFFYCQGVPKVCGVFTPDAAPVTKSLCILLGIFFCGDDAVV